MINQNRLLQSQTTTQHTRISTSGLCGKKWINHSLNQSRITKSFIFFRWYFHWKSSFFDNFFSCGAMALKTCAKWSPGFAVFRENNGETVMEKIITIGKIPLVLIRCRSLNWCHDAHKIKIKFINKTTTIFFNKFKNYIIPCKYLNNTNQTITQQTKEQKLHQTKVKSSSFLHVLVNSFRVVL